MPNAGQIILILVAAAVFAAGGIVSFVRPSADNRFVRVAAKSLVYWGLLTCVGALVWHGLARGRWEPVADNFDALVWLAVLVAAFAAYVQATRPLAALDWVLLPVAVGLLAAAAVFGRAGYHLYVDKAWTTVHLTTCFAGAAFFAVAAAGGTLYVVASDRLRAKRPAVRYLGSLERLEKLNLHAVTFGFALLTVGIVTGAVEMLHDNKTTSPWKIALAAGVWVVYALVLHAPINPVFRGRRAAQLSVVGFALMIGVLAAVQFGGPR